jgi:endonuclease/exonuclease/phosphatase family metal-dependent hydrolase
VRRCLGLDGKLAPGRIAEIIAEQAPDIVALQELDVFRARSGSVDQAHEIAQLLGMERHFNPAMQVMEELYGDAILTALPSTLIKAGALPGLAHKPRLEPRGAVWASIKFGAANVQVVNTHLGLRRSERMAQIEALLGPHWIGHPACREPYILVGDFNALPSSLAYRKITSRVMDAQRAPKVAKPSATFPVRLPFLRIDHVFVSGGIEVLRAETVRNRLTRVASDHLPLVIDFAVHGGAERSTEKRKSAAATDARSSTFKHNVHAEHSPW